MFGADLLVELLQLQGIGFAVYKAELTYKGPAHFGDILDVQSSSVRESPYRLTFNQNVVRVSDGLLLVKGVIQLVCIKNGSLVEIPL